MKVRFTFFVFLSILFVGCAGQKELTKEQSEKIFEHNTPLSKDQIKSKLLTFVNENFVSGKAVIQTNDDGILSGNYNFNLGNYDPLGMYQVFTQSTFIIKYLDNSFKMKMLVKDLYLMSSQGEKPLTQTMWGNYANEIQTGFNNFDSTLVNYLNSKDTF